MPPPSTYIWWPSHCATESGRILLGADADLVTEIRGEEEQGRHQFPQLEDARLPSRTA